MKAVTFHGPEIVRCDDVPPPELVSPTDALVRVGRSAVCGSDLHVYHGRETGLDQGTILGHEFVGEVVAAGEALEEIRPGARVASPFTTSCGECFYCRHGLPCRCEFGRLFGWVEGGQGLHGAQAELVRVPLADATLVPIPPAVPDEVALLAGDVLATGEFCAEQGEVTADQVVVVLGCGPVGLCAARAAVRRGAARVLAVDRVRERLELAARFGAEPLDLQDEDVYASVAAATEGRGADVVLEAVGNPQALRLAWELVRPGGTISAVGVHTEPHLAFSPADAYDKNLTYRTGRCPARRFLEPLLAELAERPEDGSDLAHLFSHRMSLDEAPLAYDVFARKLEGCTKVVFEL